MSKNTPTIFGPLWDRFTHFLGKQNFPQKNSSNQLFTTYFSFLQRIIVASQ